MNADAVQILSAALLDPSANASPFAAAGTGARDLKRLSWGDGRTDVWDSGRAAQGFLIWNDGESDANIGLTSADLTDGGQGGLFTVPAGTWMTFPYPTSTLFAGSGRDGTVLLFVFDYSPPPAAGVIRAPGTSYADVAALDFDASTDFLIADRNPARVQTILYGAQTDPIYVLFGDVGDNGGALYTLVLQPGGTAVITNYTGRLTGWSTADSGGGPLLVTEA